MVKILSSSSSFVYCLGFLFLNFSINVYAAGSSISAAKIDSGSSEAVRNGASIPHHRTKRDFALLVPRDEEESSEEHLKSKRCWMARPVQKVRLSSLYPEEITSYDNQKRSVENYWNSGDDKTVEKLRLVPLKNPRDNLKGFLHLDDEEEDEEGGDSGEDILRRIRNHLKSDDYKVLALVGKRAKNHPVNNRRKLICYCREANCSGGDCDRMMYRPCSTCSYPAPGPPTDWYSNYGRVPLNVRYPATRNHFVDYSTHGDRLQGQKSRNDGIPSSDPNHGRIFKIPVASNQYQPTNARFISTDPRLAMNQYHPAIGSSGVIRPSHHEGSVRFWPPGSQSSQHLGAQVTDGPQSTSTNVFYGGNGFRLVTRPQVYPNLQNARVPTRKIAPQHERTTQSMSWADNPQGFPDTVTHYDSTTEYRLPSTDTLVLTSNDIHRDGSIEDVAENVDKIGEQKYLDYNGVSDEPSRYKFPVVYTEDIHSEEGNDIPETWGASMTLEPRKFHTIPDIVGSNDPKYSFVETTTSHDQSIQSTEYFDSDELKTRKDSEDERSTTEDYSDIRVITNGYFTSEAFDDLGKADLQDFGPGTKIYANTDRTDSYEEEASNSRETIETQMESASMTPDFIITGVETSTNLQNDDSKNVVDTRIIEDGEIVSKIREKGDRTHDHTMSSNYDSKGDSQSLEARSELIMSNSESSWVESLGDQETTTSSSSSRRMPSEEIFESYEPQESSEYRDSASIERVGDQHAYSGDHESISPEEKSIYTTYEEEDEVPENSDDDSERLFEKHVDHDQDSVEIHSVEAPIKTCSMTHAFNPDKTAVEYTREDSETPGAKNDGEYLNLAGEEPAIDKSATKYFSPNDRVLEYIKKHSQNLVRDTEDYCHHGSTETPQLYHTQSVSDYPESEEGSVDESQEILQRPFDLDEDSRDSGAQTESEDVSRSEEEAIIQDPESQIAGDSFSPETNVQVSRDHKDSDHSRYSPEVDLIQDYNDDEDRSSRDEVLLPKGASEGLAGISRKTEGRQQDEDERTSVEGLLEIQHLNNFSGDQTTETVEDSREFTSRSFEEDEESATLSTEEEDNHRSISDTTGSLVLEHTQAAVIGGPSKSSEEDHSLDETTRKSITEDSMVLENPQRLDDNVGIIHVQEKPLLHRDHEYKDYTEESITDYSTENSYTDEQYSRQDYTEETTKIREKVTNGRQSTTESFNPDSTYEEDEDQRDVHEAETAIGGRSSKSRGKVMSGQQENTESFGPDSTSEEDEDQPDVHGAEMESIESQENHSVTKSEKENVLLQTLERINDVESQNPESRSNTKHHKTDDVLDQVLHHQLETSPNSPGDVGSLSDEEMEDHDLQSSEATTILEPIDTLSSTILHKMDGLEPDQSLEEMKSVEFVGGPSTCDRCTGPPEVGEDAGYLGRLAPKNPDAVIRSVGDLVKSDLYYIGDGVRLPLKIKKLKDGSFALSISDKVCDKRPCCVPRGGEILEERRSEDLEESGVHRRAADDESQHHKRVTRSIVMPVDEFVEKYNLVIDLDDRDSSPGHNVIQRDEQEQEFEGYDTDLVGRMKSMKDLPEDQRAKVLLEALNEFTGMKASEVFDEEFRSSKSREEDGGVGFRYGYQRDNPILDRIEMIKKLRDQMYECEHKYQRDCDLAVTQKTELLKMILYWIKDLVSSKGI